jgi:hypothetical protein
MIDRTGTRMPCMSSSGKRDFGLQRFDATRKHLYDACDKDIEFEKYKKALGVLRMKQNTKGLQFRIISRISSL